VANSGVLVHCELAGDKLAPIAIELLGAGSRLAAALGQSLSAVVIGANVGGAAQEAIAYGAAKVYAADDAILKDYLTDSYLSVMEKVVQQSAPQIVLLGLTLIGRDLTPRLAFRLKTVATLDCIGLEIDAATKRLLQTKPVYGGNALSVVVSENYPQIAAVRMKTMAPAVKNPDNKGEVINVAAGIDAASIRTKVIGRKAEDATGIKLEDAHAIVSGGRGIGGPDGFKQLDELAKLLKGAVGASRPACDNKWVADSLQIGLTGKLVSPDLYIAIALSGSSQHMSGCSGSKVIVAINKDPEANIFKVAHYGIVADWKKALPAFTNKVKQLS
jgi:electron transfer flavoprotein alpha subunit